MKYTMSHTVTLSEETRFHVSSHETVLNAATRQNLNLPHSCKNGICGQCKADLISGEMTMSEHSAKALSAQEKAQGKILLCCTTAQSDLSIHIDGYNPHAQKVKTLPAALNTSAFSIMSPSCAWVCPKRLLSRFRPDNTLICCFPAILSAAIPLPMHPTKTALSSYISATVTMACAAI